MGYAELVQHMLNKNNLIDITCRAALIHSTLKYCSATTTMNDTGLSWPHCCNQATCSFAVQFNRKHLLTGHFLFYHLIITGSFIYSGQYLDICSQLCRGSGTRIRWIDTTVLFICDHSSSSVPEFFLSCIDLNENVSAKADLLIMSAY